ncbi:MAG: methyltransferase domain-containing protein [Solirubrobacteraceae bacterium]|nr:methyltransferase domain-containing protein [Solirubrobacteraceae bacterium]
MSQSNARRRAALAYQAEHDVSYRVALEAVSNTAGALYDRIGHGYAVQRRADPRIAARIEAALGDAETVLNVGAGTGSYEPVGRQVLAVEPSAVMRAQRPADAAPCLAARADDLPFEDDQFDVAMAILSDHHWADPIAGLRELRRVARRVVVLQWDTLLDPSPFWLVRDYLPEFAALAAGRPSLQARADAIGATMTPVPIPHDCTDAFFPAHWRRPHAYLDESVRRSTSVWTRLGPRIGARAVEALTTDLASGTWHHHNDHLLSLEELDTGARLLVTP